MNQLPSLDDLLSGVSRPSELFALLSLGVVESLAGGVMTSSEAVRLFFHADNCLFVREDFKDEIADEVMGRGVQLPTCSTPCPPTRGTASSSTSWRRCGRSA